MRRWSIRWSISTAGVILTAASALLARPSAQEATTPSSPEILLKQPQPDADHKSSGCLSCHSPLETPTMHQTGTVRLGCTDCHGGNAEARIAAGSAPDSAPLSRNQEASASAIPLQQYGCKLCQPRAQLHALAA